jgi:hypothetical protein
MARKLEQINLTTSSTFTSSTYLRRLLFVFLKKEDGRSWTGSICLRMGPDTSSINTGNFLTS